MHKFTAEDFRQHIFIGNLNYWCFLVCVAKKDDGDLSLPQSNNQADKSRGCNILFSSFSCKTMVSLLFDLSSIDESEVADAKKKLAGKTKMVSFCICLNCVLKCTVWLI